MLVNGSIVALVTPFCEDGSIHFAKLNELVEFHIANKTDAILVLGTTGETPTLTHEEDIQVAKAVIAQANGRIPVYVGAGSNNTQVQITYAKKYEELGADGLLIISPYYNKANEEGMYQHFKMTADAVNIPVILYNVPSRTGCPIPFSVVKRLCTHKNVQAIKEASGDISYLAKVATLLSDDFQMYVGNDDMILAALAYGASGVISVVANILPLETHTMVSAYLANDVVKARDLQLKYLDLINALFIETNPIPVKTAMNEMGLAVGGYRFPLCEMAEENKAILIEKMKVMSV